MKNFKSIKFLFIAAILMPYLLEWIIKQSHFISSLSYSENLSALIISTTQKILLAIFIFANYLDDRKILLFNRQVKIKFTHMIELTIMSWTSIIFTVGTSSLLASLFYFAKFIKPDAFTSVDRFTVDMPIYLNIYSAIILVIIAPILEEIVYRSIIVKSFYKGNSLKRSTLYAALIFAFFHPNPLDAFIFSVLSSLIYYKFKSIKYPILFHMISNATSSLFYLYPSQNSNTDVILDTSFRTILNYGLFFFAISSIIIAFYILKTNRLIKKSN